MTGAHTSDCPGGRVSSLRGWNQQNDNPEGQLQIHCKCTFQDWRHMDSGKTQIPRIDCNR